MRETSIASKRLARWQRTRSRRRGRTGHDPVPSPARNRAIPTPGGGRAPPGMGAPGVAAQAVVAGELAQAQRPETRLEAGTQQLAVVRRVVDPECAADHAAKGLVLERGERRRIATHRRRSVELEL